MRAAVFFDRDDTLIHNRALPAPAPPAAPGDVTDPALVRAVEGAVDACARLKGAGFAIVVVTNQGVVARGGLTPAGLDAVQRRLRDVFATPGATQLIDAVYACPYHPRGSTHPFVREHPWRKPAGGMLVAAAHDLGLDLGRSWMVGDAARDIEAALDAGLAPERALRIAPDARFASVVDATAHILASAGARDE